MKWPLAHDSWGAEELAAATRVLNGAQRTMGAEVVAYEREFAEYVGARYAVACNSGSSANLLMVAAMRYRSVNPLLPRDEVIVPALGWSTTYAPLAQYGLEIRPVDIDPLTFTIDADAVLAAVTPRTRAVMVVHVFGALAPTERLRAALPARVAILEDACEALGTPGVGTYGAAASFSTFFSHHMSTGEGGVVVTDDDELHRLFLMLRAHGWTRDLPGSRKDEYKFVLPGYNLRPTEMQAAVGRVQLRKLPGYLEARRRNWVRVHAYSSDAPWLTLQRGAWAPMAFGMTTGDVPRDHVRAVMRDHGIETRTVLAGNIRRTELARYLSMTRHNTPLPNADHVQDAGLVIGNLGDDLSHVQIEAFAHSLRGVAPGRHLRQ